MAALQIIKSVNGYFRFILNGDLTTSTIDNAPNCTSFDNLFHFKTKNGAVLFGEQNIAYNDITYTDISSVDFTFASVDAVWIKLISEGFFDGLGSSGGGGVSRFDNLLDTFTYHGNNGKVPVVDASQLKLIPTTFYNFKDFIQLEDVAISSLIAGKIIGVELVGGVPKVVLRDTPPSPELLANAVGWMDYADAGTTTTPLTLVANVNKKLTNDTLGAFTNTANAPFGVPTIWNSTTNSYDFNFLTVGDTIDIRFDITVTTTSANQVVKAFLRLAEGTPSQYDIPFTEVQFKTAGTHNIIRPLNIYIGSDIFRTAPASFYVVSDNGATCVVNGWYNRILRKGVNILDINAVAEWGGITGDINDQSDLISLFNGKQDVLDEDNTGALIDSFDTKATPVAADTVLIKDSEDGNKAKEVPFSSFGGGEENYYKKFPIHYIYQSTSSSLLAVGADAIGITGTQSATLYDGTFYRRTQSAATAGTTIAVREGSWNRVYANRGFYFEQRFKVADSTPISDVRGFHGLASTASIGNVNPSTGMTGSNRIVMACDGADTNWKLMYGIASGSSTIIDLGTDFPKSQTGDYLIEMWREKNSTIIFYSIHNFTNGKTVKGSVNFNPTTLTIYNFRNNNASAAICGFEVQRINLYVSD